MLFFSTYFSLSPPTCPLFSLLSFFSFQSSLEHFLVYEYTELDVLRAKIGGGEKEGGKGKKKEGEKGKGEEGEKKKEREEGERVKVVKMVEDVEIEKKKREREREESEDEDALAYMTQYQHLQVFFLVEKIR